MSCVHLGILLHRAPGTSGQLGPLTPFAERVVTLGASEGVTVTAFGPDDLYPKSGRLTAAFYWGPDEGWTLRETSLPDVVWDRCFRRPRGAYVQPFVRLGCEPINAGWIDKWGGYRLLAEDPFLAEHLPETALVEHAGSIDQMLDRHRLVYLKPVAGSVGRGIIRVARAGAGCLQLGYVSRESGKLRHTYATLGQIDRWLRRRQDGAYVVQQGLDLNVVEGRPADVRVLVQKDGQGRWRLTGMGARVAAAGRFTSNLHTGGTGMPVQTVLQAIAPLGGSEERRTVDLLEGLALRAALRLEKGVGPLGELGLDLGLDPTGQIWFIEQNFQPGRAIFAHLGRWDLFDLAHLRPVEYARFLAERKKTASAAPAAAT